MLDVLDRACTQWGMRISWDRTIVLSIGEPTEDRPAITPKGQTLEKAATVLPLWSRMVFRSQNLSRRTKVQVFRAMVMSVLLYGAETWLITKQEIRRLKTFQMRSLWDIVTLWDMLCNVDILEATGELPIKEQLRLKRLQWFRHLQRIPDHRPQKQLLRCRLRVKKRQPGGTCLGWVDVISRDLTEIPE